MNNWSTERFNVTTNAQNTYTTFPGEGGKCPPCPCLRAPMSTNRTFVKNFTRDVSLYREKLVKF